MKNISQKPYDIAINLLNHLCQSSKLSETIDLNLNETVEKILALTTIGNLKELQYYLKFLNEKGYIESDYFETEAGDLPYILTITMLGWEKYYEMQQIQKESKQAFIAMSFSDEMDRIFEGAIKPAVNATGFYPYRIDRIEHNEKICDLIISEVKKSRFLVADITNHKKGVYFEAGYALGLGIPVIWCCKDEESEISNMHFDTRQYNHILWKDIDDLKDRLEKRIKSTIL